MHVVPWQQTWRMACRSGIVRLEPVPTPVVHSSPPKVAQTALAAVKGPNQRPPSARLQELGCGATAPCTHSTFCRRQQWCTRRCFLPSQVAKQIAVWLPLVARWQPFLWAGPPSGQKALQSGGSMYPSQPPRCRDKRRLRKAQNVRSRGRQNPSLAQLWPQVLQ